MSNTTVLGIDIGRTGGFAALNVRLGIFRTWPMPPSKERGVDLEAVYRILEQVSVEGSECGIEWNKSRPGEVPDYAFRFGLQQGQIQAMAWTMGFRLRLIDPSLWVGRLGLVGKKQDPGCVQRAKVFDSFYPAHAHLIRGPRGGILDGILDACLIAHWMRVSSAEGMKSLGKGSPLLLAQLLSGGRPGGRRLPKPRIGLTEFDL